MKPDDIEEQIRRQPLRRPPGQWRDEILAAASAAQPSPQKPRESLPFSLSRAFSTLLWPSPKAWGALAAVWVVILFLNLDAGDASSGMLADAAPPTPAILAALAEQRRMYAQLVESQEPQPSAEPARPYQPRPRSDHELPVLFT